MLFHRWADLACEIAIRAVKTVTVDEGEGHREIDTKRYAKIEKIPGGTIEDSRVLAGVMFNKVVLCLINLTFVLKSTSLFFYC